MARSKNNATLAILARSRTIGPYWAFDAGGAQPPGRQNAEAYDATDAADHQCQQTTGRECGRIRMGSL